jgi:hypothetical protein
MEVIFPAEVLDNNDAKKLIKARDMHNIASTNRNFERSLLGMVLLLDGNSMHLV